MDQRERADRIVEQKPRLGLEDPRPHQRARIGTHVGLLERVQDSLKAPHDAGVRGDERAPIRIEHAPHRHHEILAVGRARAGISGNGPTLPFEGVEEALGAAEFDDIQVVEEFRNDIRRLGRRSLPRVEPRDSFARA